MLDSDEISNLLDILGNRNRRRIIQLLRQKPCFVTEISERLVISPKAVIEHLQLMEREQLLASRSDDRRRKYYFISRDIHLNIDFPVQSSAQVIGRQNSFSRVLANLHNLMQSREKILTNLEYLERDIDQKICDLRKYGEDFIEQEKEIDILVALSGYELNGNDLSELTGIEQEECDRAINRLVNIGVVEKNGGRYRLCEIS